MNSDIRSTGRIRFVRILLSIAALAATIWILYERTESEAIVRTVSQISPAVLALVFGTAVAAALMASARLYITARLFGYRIGFREAIAALGLGQLAGALFFQLAGQLIARSAWLARSHVPLSGTVVVTIYERISALAASLLIALSGAGYLFGDIQWNTGNSGIEPARLTLGVAAVTLAGAWLAWGHLARKAIARLTPRLVVQFLINLGMSILVQLWTMAGYILLARMLDPSVDLFQLAAATSLVMFAASVPISLAGWGVREMSAVAALGVIGLTPESAFLVAVLVGITGLAAAGLLALSALSTKQMKVAATPAEPVPHYSEFLDITIPLFAASAVFFQVFFPVESGVLNVNLADPFALLGGGVFITYCFGMTRPAWRLPGLPLYVAAATLVLTIAYLHGVASFGWTVWAFANKYLGWFVLLAYASTGALIAWRVENGRDLLIKTMVATALGIMAVDLTALILFRSGIPEALSYATLPLSGFSQNRNAFAFLLLVCTAGLFTTNMRSRFSLIGIMAAGVYLSGSRAALISFVVVLIIALLQKSIRVSQVAKVIGIAGATVCIVIIFPEIVLRLVRMHNESGFSWLIAQGVTRLGPNYFSAIEVAPGSDLERFATLRAGWEMFLDHPIFGAGLGAFFEITRRAGKAVVIHSVGLWLAAEAGLVGLVVFCAAPIGIFLRHWRGAVASRSSLLLILLLTAFAVMSLAHEILYQRGFWLLFGAALVIPLKTKDFERGV